MKHCLLRRAIGTFLFLAAAATTTHDSFAGEKKDIGFDTAAQVPQWSSDDLNFFLHGSMSTEVVPEPFLRAFIKIYPDLFPRRDLTHLGLIPDPAFGWPIGAAAWSTW